jgi:hypothetical protein
MADTHTHTCEACGKPYECSAPLERNYDGWPDPVCATRMELNPIYRCCPTCNGVDDDDESEE